MIHWINFIGFDLNWFDLSLTWLNIFALHWNLPDWFLAEFQKHLGSLALGFDTAISTSFSAAHVRVFNCVRWECSQEETFLWMKLLLGRLKPVCTALLLQLFVRWEYSQEETCVCIHRNIYIRIKLMLGRLKSDCPLHRNKCSLTAFLISQNRVNEGWQVAFCQRSILVFMHPHPHTHSPFVWGFSFCCLNPTNSAGILVFFNRWLSENTSLLVWLWFIIAIAIALEATSLKNYRRVWNFKPPDSNLIEEAENVIPSITMMKRWHSDSEFEAWNSNSNFDPGAETDSDADS